MPETWAEYLGTIAEGLRDVCVTDRHGAALSMAAGAAQWVAMTRATHDRDGHLFFIGNGGSAGMASHMATDACKNGHLRALAFNDIALMTATANDLAYDQIFSLPIERLARPGDLLISISSSGNSPNIVRGLEAAAERGLQIVTLSGMRSDNRARALGDLNFYAPLQRYGWVESAHQVILHYWFDQYLQLHGQGAV
jgi:D-sedoheptulose 7-phosphate isomerase